MSDWWQTKKETWLFQISLFRPNLTKPNLIIIANKFETVRGVTRCHSMSQLWQTMSHSLPFQRSRSAWIYVGIFLAFGIVLSQFHIWNWKCMKYIVHIKVIWSFVKSDICKWNGFIWPLLVIDLFIKTLFFMTISSKMRNSFKSPLKLIFLC